MGAVYRQVDWLLRNGTVTGLSDRELIERFREGGDRSESAFAGLVERHGPMVLGVCRSVLRDPNDVDDAFQATFLVLVRRAGMLWVRDSIGPWLYGVAGRVALRARRDADRRRTHEERAGRREDAPDLGGNHSHERIEAARTVHEELIKLPERWRGPLVLCHLEGLTHEQAARSLGVPVGTVRSRLSRGRERLKDRLIRRGLAPAASAIASGFGLGGEGSAAIVPGSLLNRTVTAAVGVASGWSLAGPVSVSTFKLTQGVLMSMFLAKAKTVAMILVIGGGTMAVSMKAGGVGLSEPASAPAAASTKGVSENAPPVPPSVPATPAVAPIDRSRRPLLSTVQIEIPGSRGYAFASGTVISSTPEESIILTCGHVFKLDGIPQPAPSHFPMHTTVRLFKEDSPNDSTGRGPLELAFSVSYMGEVIDYDLKRDLGLIRIRPQSIYQPPASPIVPTDWKPKKGMQLLSVGSPERGLPTALATKIVTPRLRGLLGRMDYEGIECEKAPRPGRFGGGLFTDDGYLAGVCNFADKKGNRGIFAAPTSIYQFLDRNGLKGLYTQKTPAQASEQPSETPAQDPDSAKTPEPSFDAWLRETERDLGSERTVKTLKSIFDQMVNDEGHLAEEMQRVQKKRMQVGRLLDVAEKLQMERAPFPSPIKNPSATKPNQPMVPDQAENKKPDSPDVEARLKEVEQKLDRVLKLLEEKAKPPSEPMPSSIAPPSSGESRPRTQRTTPIPLSDARRSFPEPNPLPLPQPGESRPRTQRTAPAPLSDAPPPLYPSDGRQSIPQPADPDDTVHPDPSSRSSYVTPAADDTQVRSPYVTPAADDTHSRLKDVERKLDSLLQYLKEKAKASADEASRPPAPPAPLPF
jgi:RNA polymerase sigma factor (sigma-70 family)